ncbi:hypothetical protein ABFS83_04G168400 [Erythranthe nasuta]
MAAYAAVVSLMNVIYNIQNHHQFSISLFDEKQAESLGEKLDFLLDFIESNHSTELLESEIASAAHAAEDVIESHIVDQIHSGSISSLDLQKLIKVMDHMKDKVVHFKEEKGGLSKVHQQYSMSATSSTAPITGGGKSTKMVGCEEELIQLLDAFTGRQPSLQIIPIEGMGGIGKTTLARNAYESRLIVNHFDICAWATISQEYSLKEIFSKLLSGKEKMMLFLTDNNNGSRIILTTRLSNVAVHFGSSYVSKKFLDEDKSWKLLCEKAFVQEGCCTPELEKIGKKIAKKCKGFPLLIVVIGGLLRNHLPTHLKPCFFNMGIFPKDRDIYVSKFIALWIAEGFIKPNKTQSLEEVAECYLKDLIDMNLLLVGRLRWNGKIKTCTIHDLLIDLCIKTTQKEKFLYLIKSCDSPRGINNAFYFMKILQRLLRVFDVIDCDSSMNDIVEQVDLRYVKKLSYFRELDHTSRELCLSISLLWNVQTLNIGGTERLVALSEIWSIPQLTHLEFPEGIYLMEPPLRSGQNNDCIVLKNLQTLKRIKNLKLSEEVCKRIPNVKILKIRYIDKSSCDNFQYNIGTLHKLESLNLWGVNLVRNLKFPSSLKRFTLTCSNLDWEDLTGIGSLPNLEVLKLGKGSVLGSEWNPIEGEFLCLKYLSIVSFELEYWNAESFHFPVLEKLVVDALWKLYEIPSGIGEIPTLALIDMDDCSESAAISAIRILEEQESQGNDDLRVHIKFMWSEELEGFKSSNLQFGRY